MAKAPAKKQDAPKPAQPGTGVAPADGGALILTGDKQDLSHIKKGTQRGSEQVKTEDVAIPRLEIVQSVSPQIDKDSPEYIEGAKVGDLLNSVTNQVYGKEVFVVNVHYTKQWLIWKDRKKGGGFFGAFPNPEEAADRLAQECGTDNPAKQKEMGFEVTDTPTHLCLLVDAKRGTVDEIMLPMPRTKAKVSRAWNAMIRMTGQDRFARVYRVTTAQETNKRSEKYQNYVVAACGAPAVVLYQRAEKLYEAVAKGGRVINMDTKGFDAGAEGDPSGDAEM